MQTAFFSVIHYCMDQQHNHRPSTWVTRHLPQIKKQKRLARDLKYVQ